ncbi:hypothetical protein [Pseudomonas nitroreducens]|uniref:hypothetical protein n=1 Tax=Pseudomonas nitroreducens TaxID=46680 RepID=UPI002D7E2AEB|nr:hypothetical protein [Pseudomonas nitroreducens]
MLIAYTANGAPGELPLPTSYVDNLTAESLAELAASDYWRYHPSETPTETTLIHLTVVDGRDLGVFEVRRDWRPVFTATALSTEQDQPPMKGATAC